MNELRFSFIIPVYNRPEELKELLTSFTNLKGQHNFEIVIIEDGSTKSSKAIVKAFTKRLNISYFFKPNTGPGDSRNYGMKNAKGNYFIILDSDVILPEQYLNVVSKFLNNSYVDCYGAPDAAHETFTAIQKAISFSMTSPMTTGGIRGGRNQKNSFQARSFNMGISKKAFLDSGGFGNIHPGEDPDLSLRLKDLGFKSALIIDAFVYHKRRISFKLFYKQMYKFGLVRPILNQWHPKHKRLVFWFPALFSLGLVVSFMLFLFHIKWLFFVYALYFSTAFLLSILAFKSIIISVYVLFAILIQFFGYGYGFLTSVWLISVLNKNPELVFPHLFFKKL